MEPLLKVEDLTIAFKEDDKETVVVDKVSFNVNSGEILCIVGDPLRKKCHCLIHT